MPGADRLTLGAQQAGCSLITTRREFIGIGAVGLVAVGIAGRYVLTAGAPAAPKGDFPVRHGDAEWKALLAPASYRVLRKAATERPYTSALLAERRHGIFACAGCGKPAFRSETKYDSHTGWPSFWQVLPGAVVEREDRSFAATRTEIACADCGSHLGHLFDDGPKPTGLRYCMNGVALTFKPTTV
ncbi:MAG: peptide-methionine (R)-S-oxide reductase MsrB [Sphingomonas sp.]|jgi:peptide-methionine (R)-S-oxide reductase|uniref:peptide-methionine (R)-S-oxide reductase MsrB n=1 Tax=Sphingomonas sp. TaxID=28214 RepID=UPI003566F4CB